MKKAHFVQRILLALSTNKLPFGLLIIALSCSPDVVLANGGSPLLMSVGFQLIYGNALIGVVEGLLLAIFFRLSIAKSIVSLIVINYISAWTGFTCLSGLLYYLQDVNWFHELEATENSAIVIFLTLFFFSFCLTLLIETRLLIWEFRKTGLVRKSIIKASVCVNMVTYSFLLVCYVYALSQPDFTPAYLAKYEKVQSN